MSSGVDSGGRSSLQCGGKCDTITSISLAKDSYSPGMRCLNAFGSNLQISYSCAKSAISELTDSPDVFGETAEIGMLRSGALRFKGHIMAEEWRSVSGYEGLYEVSNKGRVRRTGKAYGAAVPGKILGYGDGGVGYVKVRLYTGNCKCKTFRVHHLVLAAFVGPCPDGMVCNHKNGIKSDNRVENLEWVTYSQNTQHGFDVLHRDTPRGEGHGMAKLSEDQVIEIRRLYLTGNYSQHQLAKMFNIGRRGIQAVVTLGTWKHIKANYHVQR